VEIRLINRSAPRWRRQSQTYHLMDLQICISNHRLPYWDNALEMVHSIVILRGCLSSLSAKDCQSAYDVPKFCQSADRLSTFCLIPMYFSLHLYLLPLDPVIRQSQSTELRTTKQHQSIYFPNFGNRWADRLTTHD